MKQDWTPYGVCTTHYSLYVTILEQNTVNPVELLKSAKTAERQLSTDLQLLGLSTEIKTGSFQIL